MTPDRHIVDNTIRGSVPEIGMAEIQKATFERLYAGIRNTEDPVTWRTLIVDSRTILGSMSPEFDSPSPVTFEKASELVSKLVEETYLKPLIPEILVSIGYGEIIKDREIVEKKPLDTLLFNGRHRTEPLLWSLAAHLSLDGKETAVVNPVGHYNDGQTRIVAPSFLTRQVEKLVIVSSTQEMYGGNVNVLANVINTLREPKISERISDVYVVIPMFGGSRGHRIGQSEETGIETREAEFNAMLLALTTNQVHKQLEGNCNGCIPTVHFVTVDIHNNELPGNVFRNEGYDFISATPAPEFAESTYNILEERGLLTSPLKVIACDEGARERTENCAIHLLQNPRNKLKQLEIINVRKERKTAGVVDKVEFTSAARLELRNNQIEMNSIEPPTPGQPSFEECVVFSSDDMLDTGGTSESDSNLLGAVFPNAKLRIFAATHPVLSKGFGTLDRINADIFLLGNTLSPEGLGKHPKVIIVDMAPAIAREIDK